MSFARVGAASVLGSLVFSAATLVAALSRPGWFLDFDPAIVAPEAALSGMYPAERGPDGLTFSWTASRASIRVPWIDRRVAWRITVRTGKGGRPPSVAIPEVEVYADGLLLDRRRINNLGDITVETQALTSGARGVELTLAVAPSFQPAPPGAGGDTRELGVIIDWIRMTPLASPLPEPSAFFSATIAGAAFGTLLSIAVALR